MFLRCNDEEGAQRPGADVLNVADILWGGNAVSWSCGVPCYETESTEGCKVCPLTVTAGWSGGGGFGVCAWATARSHTRTDQLGYFLMWLELEYTSDPRPRG